MKPFDLEKALDGDYLILCRCDDLKIVSLATRLRVVGYNPHNLKLKISNGDENFWINSAGFSAFNSKVYMQVISDMYDDVGTNYKKTNKIPINFELFDQQMNELFARSKVYGGWLVKVSSNSHPFDIKSMVFVPDPNHEWEV